MAGSHSPSPLLAPSVHGLDRGRKKARRRSARRRVKNTVVAGVMFLVAVGAAGAAGYYVWQFYGDEQARDRTSGSVDDQRGTDELIQDFEDNPRFNGPGAPAFGIDDAQP